MELGHRGGVGESNNGVRVTKPRISSTDTVEMDFVVNSTQGIQVIQISLDANSFDAIASRNKRGTKAVIQHRT